MQVSAKVWALGGFEFGRFVLKFTGARLKFGGRVLKFGRAVLKFRLDEFKFFQLKF